MLRKYVGKFNKYEAEVVQEILDWHDQDEMKARKSILSALQGDMPDCVPENLRESFMSTITFFVRFYGATWWAAGLERLGLIKKGEALPPIESP